jgi:hypothetical protein
MRHDRRIGSAVARSTDPWRGRRVRAATAALLALLLALPPIGGVLLPPGDVRAGDTVTALLIEGEPNEPISGNKVLITDPSDGIVVADMTDISTFRYWAVDAGYEVTLASPAGTPLVAGTYTNARRTPFRPPGSPGINVSGGGVGCNETFGEFTVHEITKSGDTLTSFSASFSQRCENDIPPNLYGEVRFNSTPFPHLGASTTAIDLGVAVIGDENPPGAITLTSDGYSAVTISGFEMDGPDADEFEVVSEDCPATPLAPSVTCEVSITATPTGAGTRTAQLHVLVNTGMGVVRVGLQVVTEPIVVSPGTLDLGDVPFDSIGYGTVTLTNAGDSDLFIGPAFLDGLDSGFFSADVSVCSGAWLPGGDSCQIPVTFDPEEVRDYEAQLSLTLPVAGATVVPILGTAVPSRWGDVAEPGPSFGWNDGHAMARTASGDGVLHTVAVSDVIGGDVVTNNGPYMGIYYTNSSDGGDSWSADSRLNPNNQHAARAAVAASGPDVYVIWVSQAKVTNLSGTAPRVIYFRRNSSNGDPTAWRGTVRLTSSTGRVDYPTIAASGKSVYVTYTNSATGDVVVRFSRDRGATWKTVKVGATGYTTTQGKFGYPVVAAAGSNVSVAWLAAGAGRIKARVSKSSGTSFGSAVTLGRAGYGGLPTTAARGSRLAFAWGQSGRIHLRIWSAGTWGTERTMAKTQSLSYELQLTPAITLLGTSDVGLAYGSCRADCGFEDQDLISSTAIVWTTSANGGATWGTDEMAASPYADEARQVNLYPSIVWVSPDGVHLVWTGWSDEVALYRLFARTRT